MEVWQSLVYCTGLENRQGMHNPFLGSNPRASANFLPLTGQGKPYSDNGSLRSDWRSIRHISGSHGLVNQKPKLVMMEKAEQCKVRFLAYGTYLLFFGILPFCRVMQRPFSSGHYRVLR